MSFPANDAAALRRTLETLDPATLPEWGERGHARFIAEYTAEKMVDAVDRVYRSALDD